MRTLLAASSLAGLLAILLPAPASAQTDYTLSFEQGGTRWRVEARLPGRGEESLDFRMPLWTPGAYHVADYGRFVKELRAFDSAGRELEVKRPDKGHFVLGGTAGAEEVVVRYEAESMSSGLFTNMVIDVEANRIAKDYAYVNPVSLFGFVPERMSEAVRLKVEAPAGWRAATVLEHDEEGRFLAPSYLRFEDSPLLFSPTLESATFEVEGKPHTVSVHGRGAEDARAIAAGCKRLVEAGSKLMGGLPYDRYHFLYGFVEEGGGSGLEHSFSTLILLSPSTGIEEDEHEFWGITAHEYFHLWCAERIHVAAIHAPDLLQPLETGTIWVNEGITEYFCRHLLLHAGFEDERELLDSYLRSQVPVEVLRKQPWTDVSRAAPDWSGMNDVMVFAMRMYEFGPRTIFALDMTMRRATEGERGILDLLRCLVSEYVDRDRGFGEEELESLLARIGGDEASEFYERFIDGDEIPDPADYLDVIGYRAEGGRAVALESASAEQLRARRDYFSVTGEP